MRRFALYVLTIVAICGCKRAHPSTEAVPTRDESGESVAEQGTTFRVVPRAAIKPPFDPLHDPEYRFTKENVDALCGDQWTKRGVLNKGMFRYCVSQETEAHADLFATLKRLSNEGWVESLLPKVWSRWTKRGVTKYSMVAYELKQQNEGHLDYEYAKSRPNYDANKMSACEREWISHANRWTMTMYCYKQ